MTQEEVDRINAACQKICEPVKEYVSAMGFHPNAVEVFNDHGCLNLLIGFGKEGSSRSDLIVDFNIDFRVLRYSISNGICNWCYEPGHEADYQAYYNEFFSFMIWFPKDEQFIKLVKKTLKEYEKLRENRQ